MRYTFKVGRRSGSKFWWATVYIEGEGGSKRRFSTGVAIGDRPRESQRAAERAAADHVERVLLPELARARAGAPAPQGSPAQLDAVAERMLRAKRADGKRPRAVDGLAFWLDKWVVPWFGATRDVRTIRRADLEAFKAHLRETEHAKGRGLSEQSINNALTAVRQVLKHACQVEELLEAVPQVANVRRANVPKGRALAPAELALLLGAINPREVEARHFLTLVANTGMRKAEALAVRFSWIDWDARVIRVPPGANKGGRPREPVVLNDAALEVLRARRGLQDGRRDPDDDRVFRERKHDEARNEAAARVGLGRVRTHDLRHSLGSNRVAAGATLTEVRDDLGHRTMAMVNHYQHSYEERRLATAQQVQVRPASPAEVARAARAVPGAVPGEDGPRGEIQRDPAQRSGPQPRRSPRGAR